MRFVLVFLLAFLATIGDAQQAAGGYGQGGAGGGAGLGGGMGGRSGTSDDEPEQTKARPEEGEDADLWATKAAILSPGDRVEIKYVVHKGEVLMATVTSDAFDPAIIVQDANGKELAKNDDREEGDQSPFVIVRFPEAGTYTLKVVSYGKTSGGKFTLKSRTFVPLDAPLGKTSYEIASNEAESALRTVFRISAKKDRIFDLKSVLGIRPRPSGSRFVRIFGPTGVVAKDFESITAPGGGVVFRALADGDYYAEYAFNTDTTRIETDFQDVAVVAIKATGEVPIDLAPGELKIVELPVTPNLIVRTTISGEAIQQTLSAPTDPRERSEPNGDSGTGYGSNRRFTWFKLDIDLDDNVVRIFHGSGTARFAIRSYATALQKALLKNEESLPLWSNGKPISGTLGIGETRLYLLKSTKSELMKVAAKAPAFQAKLDIFRLSGELANSIMDRRTHTAADDLYFPDAGTFVVRITCDGFGGSGEYTMRRDTLTAQTYALGTATTLTLDGGNFGLYEVELEASKRYQLTTDRPKEPLRADLLDEDGQFLVSQRIRFDEVEIQYFVPTRSGRHRLWLRGALGVRHFKFEPHTPPTIGGMPR